MATGRIGSTPVLRVRWSDQPTAGTTVLSGLDDNSVALVYDAGYEAVYRNGVLLSRGNDYTATDGTTVTLIDATLDGDIIEIFANDLVPLTDAISKGQYNAKGALLSATAASTPGVLAVGANATVLTADSTTSTGLAWATPSSGGMTQLATGTLSGATTTISSISGTYKNLQLVIRNFLPATDSRDIRIRFNGDSGTRYSDASIGDGSSLAGTFSGTSANMGGNADNAVTQSLLVVEIPDYANTTTWKFFTSNILANNATTATDWNWYGQVGFYNQTAAIDSITLVAVTSTFTSGDYILYGVQ